MTDERLPELRDGLTAMVRAAMAPGARVRHETLTVYGEMALILSSPVGEDGQLPTPPPLDAGQLLGLAALLKDAGMTPQVLADFLLDSGHEYATAVAEKAAREERERIAERLYGEASHILARGPDPDGTFEFAAASLSSVADDLVFGVPPTAPATRPPAE